MEKVVFVVSRGLVTCDLPPAPLTESCPVGVYESEIQALEAIESLDDGLGRYWDVDTMTIGQTGGGGAHGYGQETWRSRLQELRERQRGVKR